MPFDRRVWQEALALRGAGHTVSVICPKGKGFTESHEIRDGVYIYRHDLVEAKSAGGYPAEYLTALMHQLRLSLAVRRRQRIDAIQACNPPDLMFLIALFHRLLFGTRFLFDHHDLSPELYVSRFGRKDALFRVLSLLERLTFRLADASIATNETFRDIAISRGNMDPDRVFVVKSYPDPEKTHRCPPEPALVQGGKCIIGYVGIMGAQDGVETLIRAMDHIVFAEGRRDIKAVLVGDGPEFERLKALARTLNLEDAVTFTGYLSGPTMMQHLSAFDIGVIPDPPNGCNEKLSMNKVFEYMMLGIPFVQFNLAQARREAGSAALVTTDHSAAALARNIMVLVDDGARRRVMASRARAIAGREFLWSTQATRYLEAIDCLFTGKEIRT
ncbi:glycosyltransferase family 4 protein [Devosia crocina]|uniref:glycosyltransferase family 4 protein n=1 Tax=Devosia crocina TaxID=429728 RepID=UPI001FCD11CF|nr:glycosyltransferase family 4 protein [Devosia crocina]